MALNHSIVIEISRKIAFGTTWVLRGLGSINKGPNATIRLVRRQNHAGTTVSRTTVQQEKSSHAYKLSSNVQTACSTDSLNNCPKHSNLRFSSFALKIYLWLKMCQHNLPCSIVYAHCLLPWRAFASLYVLLFLEKAAEIGGRDKTLDVTALNCIGHIKKRVLGSISCDPDLKELPPEFFCQTSFWQNDLVLLVDIES